MKRWRFAYKGLLGFALVSSALVPTQAVAAVLSISTPSAQTAVVGNSFSLQIVASGGTGGNTFSVFSGTLPSGLSLNSSTGVISGSALGAESNPISIRVTDNSSATATTSTFYISTGWQVTTFAGNGSASASGDGGQAILAGFSPHGLAIDSNDNLYISDLTAMSIRKINTSGVISTVASAMAFQATGLAANSNGDIFIPEWSTTGRIYKYTNSLNSYSAWSNAATTVKYPRGLTFDPSGNLYVAEYSGFVVKKISSDGSNITVFAGTGVNGDTGDGGAATSANLNTPMDVARDSNGNFYISEYSGCRIRKVNPSGIISTIFGGSCTYGGDGGLAINATSRELWGITVDNAGNVFFVERNGNGIRRIDATTGIVTRVAGSGTTGITGQVSNSVSSLTVFGAIVMFARFDSQGNLYVVDYSNNVIRKIANIGIMSPRTSATTLSSSGNFRKGLTSVISGTVNVPGKVTFKSNGKKIPGCISMSVNGSGSISISCTWKPAVSGSALITAELVPLDQTIPSSKTTVEVQISRRTAQR